MGRDGPFRRCGRAGAIRTLRHLVEPSPSEPAMRTALHPAVAGLLPALHARLLRWCAGNAWRLANPVTFTAIALYHEPRSAFLGALLGQPLSAVVSDPLLALLPASVSTLLC
jgi:hypothetical protein